jgi:hypothetical protein
MVPGKDSIWLRNSGNLSQDFFAQFGADLSEFLALTVHELYTTVDLLAHETIFCQQVGIAQFEGFVYRL